MSIENDVFKRYTPDFKKLIGYGFIKSKNNYFYEKTFRNDEFKAVIEIDKKGNISGKVFDMENDDEFLPIKYSPDQTQGAFIGEIREEYKKILKDIRDNCFSKNYFIYPQSNRITNLIIAKYGNKPDFMWENYTDGVFKNPDSNKWYGIIMIIDYSKLDKSNKGPVEVINLKLDTEEIQTLLKQEGFYPAWHMNKKYWITITLDETLPDDKIMDLIEESHSYTAKSKKKL